MNQRVWSHTETPTGKPSAAAYRTGCKCEDCRQANITYMRLYHARIAALEDNADGTVVYHVHKGAPSRTTAIKWGCTHPRCLHLAGLYFDAKTQQVRWKADDTVADKFGVPVAPVV